jgi:hypothetical protein
VPGAIAVELVPSGRVSGLLSENTLERRPEAQGNARFITAELRYSKHCLEGRSVSRTARRALPRRGREGRFYAPAAQRQIALFHNACREW